MNPDLSPEGIRKLLSQGEGPTVEFKAQFTTDRAIARHIIAFANSQGGVLIFGIGDKGEVLGLSDVQVYSTLGRLKRLANSLLPADLFQIATVEIDGKSLVYIAISEGSEAVKPFRAASGDMFLIDEKGVVIEAHEPLLVSNKKRPLTAFVAMSFRDEEEPALVDYYQAMQRAVKSTGLPIKLTRVDLHEGDYEISQEIMNLIDKVDLVIADFTLSPRNVYFELGYARGKNLRIIQTARKGTTLEFDIRNWRTIFYKNATELESALKLALNSAYVEILEKS